jgi:hypothetical protein
LDNRIHHRLVLMPQQEGLLQLRRVNVAALAELAQLTIEVLHGDLEIGQRLARIGAGLQPVTQSIELLRHGCGIGLQHACRLQGGDVGAHLRREAEACDQNCTHHQCQHGADTDRDELAIAVFACRIHC